MSHRNAIRIRDPDGIDQSIETTQYMLHIGIAERIRIRTPSRVMYHCMK